MRHALVVSAALLALAGCIEDKRRTPDPSAITETGFLAPCDPQGDCDDGLSCVCGVCTRSCDDGCGDGACNTPPDGPACVPPAGVCLGRCDRDADCAAGLVCAAGACIGAPPDGDADLPRRDATVRDAALPDAELPDAEIPDAEIPDVAVPDVETPDAEIPDAEVPDAGPACRPEDCDDGDPCTVDRCDPATGCQFLEVGPLCVPGEIVCQDALSRELADLATAMAVSFQLRQLDPVLLPAGAEREVDALAALAIDIAEAVRTPECLADPAATFASLMQAYRAVVAHLVATADAERSCEANARMAEVNAALEGAAPPAGFGVLWDMVYWLSAPVDAIPEGNAAIRFVAGDAEPLQRDTPRALTVRLEDHLHPGAVSYGELLVEAEMTCPGWAVEIPSRVPAGDAELVATVTPGPEERCDLRVVTTLSSNRANLAQASWTLMLGAGVDAPPLLYPQLARSPQRVAINALTRGVSIFSVALDNPTDRHRAYEVTHHVIPAADGPGAWWPLRPRAPQRVNLEPGRATSHQGSITGADVRIGATGVMRFTITAIDGVAQAPSPATVLDVPFLTVGRPVACGTCSPEACDDGDPCTTDSCSPRGWCAHTVDPTCEALPPGCPFPPSARLQSVVTTLRRVLRERELQALRDLQGEAAQALRDAHAAADQPIGALANASSLARCLPEDEALAGLRSIAEPLRALFELADRLGVPLWAPGACGTDDVLDPVEAALAAGDVNAAIDAHWAWLVPNPPVPQGDVSLAFTGLGALPPLEAGRPVEVGVNLGDRYFGGCQQCPDHTHDIEARMRCPTWTVAPGRRVALTAGEDTYPLAFTVTPGDEPACDLEVTATLRENGGLRPSQVVLPLRLGRAPGRAALNGLTQVVGEGPHPLNHDGNGVWFYSLRLNNHDDVPHTYAIGIEAVGDLPGWDAGPAIRQEDVPPSSDLPAPLHADGLRLDIELTAPPGVDRADLVDTAVELRATLLQVDGVDVPEGERDMLTFPFVVREPLVCE